MELTKEIRKKLREMKKLYGNVSVSWIQYKYHVSFKEAERIREEFLNG